MNLNKDELYRSVVENTPDVITRWSSDLSLIYANPAFETKTGIAGDSLYGKTSAEMGQPDDIALPWMESLRKVFATGRPVEHYNSFPTPTGIVHFYTRMVPEKNGNGKIETVLAIARDITEITETKKQLEANRELLQSIIDVSHTAITYSKAVRDKNDGITDFEWLLVNKTASRYGGKKPLVGKRYSKEYPGVKESGVFEKYVKVVEENELHDFEIYYDHDGYNNWFRIVAAKLGDGIVTSSEDITEGKNAKQKITEDAHFIKQVLDTTPDIIYIMDLNTRQLVYASKQVAEHLGYTKSQIAAMKNPVFDIMHPEDIPSMIEHFRKMKTIMRDDTVVEIEYRLVNSKGGINWFIDRNAVFKRNKRAIPVEKIGIAQEITGRKQQEQQLLTGLEILEQAEEIVEMGCWEYDIATANFKWSEGMYRLFNLPASTQLTPDIYLDYTPEEERPLVKTIVNNIQRDFVSFEEMITLLPEDQERKVVKIKAVVIKDKKKQPVRVIGVDRDMTYEVKAAGEINELNKTLESRNLDLETLNTELRTFNNIASHDYKETIQTLYTNLEYIITRDARNLSETGKANIRRAQAAIQKMKLLTEDINGYLRLYDLPINITLIDPNPVLNDVLSKMRGKMEQAGANIELTELPHLYADPILFSLLLTHLIDNALKFRKAIGPTNIKIKYSQADEMNAVRGALKDMPYTIISVSDNGVGFREEDAEKIFDLFVRLQDKGKLRGSGIGLAVCKKIMSMHNGFITAESELAAGSVFNCYFPRDGMTNKPGSYSKPIYQLYDRNG